MNTINGTPITTAFVLMVALLLGFAGLDVSASPQSGDAEPTGADGAASTTAADAPKTAAEISSLSIVDRAPIVLDVNRRYYKFYGDAFTVNGGLLERSQLTGDWGGARDTLADSGFNFDFGITQNFMSNVDGGTSTGGLQYSGSLDMFANIDTAKLTKGAWPGRRSSFTSRRAGTRAFKPMRAPSYPRYTTTSRPEPRRMTTPICRSTT